MPDTGGVGGFHMPGSHEPKGIHNTGPTGDVPENFKGLKGSKGLEGMGLSSKQKSDIQGARSDGGFGGPISPLEMWFMQHSGKGMEGMMKGIMMYRRFMMSMMMTCVTGMSTVSKASMQRQKQADRQSYGGMA